MEDQLDILFESLNGLEGINLGTREEFGAFMTDSTNRKLLFESINSPEIYLGESFQEFDSWVNPSKDHVIKSALSTGQITVDDPSLIKVEDLGNAKYEVETPNEKFTFFNQEEANIFEKAVHGVGQAVGTFLTETAASVASLPEIIYNFTKEAGEGVFNVGDEEFNTHEVFESKLGEIVRTTLEPELTTVSSQSEDYIAARQRLANKAPNYAEILATGNPLEVGTLFSDPETRKDMARVFFSGETFAQIGEVFGLAASFFVPAGIAQKAGVATRLVKAATSTSAVKKLTESSKLAKKVADKTGTVGDFALGVELMSGIEADMEAREVEASVEVAAYNHLTDSQLSLAQYEQAKEEGILNAEQQEEAQRRAHEAGVETFNYNHLILRATNILPAVAILGKFSKPIKLFEETAQASPRLAAFAGITGAVASEGGQEVLQTAISKYEELKYASDLYGQLDDKNLWTGPGTVAKEGFLRDYDLLEAGILGLITTGGMAGPAEIDTMRKQIKTNRFKKSTPAKDFVQFKNSIGPDKTFDQDEFNSYMKDFADTVVDIALISEGQKQQNPDIVDFGFQKLMSRAIYHGLENDHTESSIKEGISQILDNNYSDKLYEGLDGMKMSYDDFKRKKMEYVDHATRAYKELKKTTQQYKLNPVSEMDYFSNWIGYDHFKRKAEQTQADLNTVEEELKPAYEKNLKSYETLRDKYRTVLKDILKNRTKTNKEFKKEEQKREYKKDPTTSVSKDVASEVQAEQEELSRQHQESKKVEIKSRVERATKLEDIEDIVDHPYVKDKVDTLRRNNKDKSIEERYKNDFLREFEFRELSQKLANEYEVPGEVLEGIPEINGQPLNEYLSIDSLEKLRTLEGDPIAKAIIDDYFGNMEVSPTIQTAENVSQPTATVEDQIEGEQITLTFPPSENSLEGDILSDDRLDREDSEQTPLDEELIKDKEDRNKLEEELGEPLIKSPILEFDPTSPFDLFYTEGSSPYRTLTREEENNAFAVFVLAPSEGLYAATTRDDGRLALPGGKVDPGETTLQAVQREAREEGWELSGDMHIIASSIVDGKPVVWYWADSATPLDEYKEKKRGIRNIYSSPQELSKTGFGNDFIASYLGVQEERLIGPVQDRIPVGQKYNEKKVYVNEPQVTPDIAKDPQQAIDGRQMILDGKVKIGDTVFLEEEDLDFPGKTDANFPVSIVGYVKDGKLGTTGNRVVFAQLPAKKDIEASMRQRIRSKGRIQTKVKDLFARVLYDNPVLGRSVDSLTDNPILAVSVGLKNPVLQTNGVIPDFIEPTIKRAGGTFVLLPWINGKLFPVRVWTKPISQLPEIEQEVKDLLAKIVADPNNAKESIDRLQTYIRWAEFEGKEVIHGPRFSVRNNKIVFGDVEYSDWQNLYKDMKVPTRRLHVDQQLINDVFAHKDKVINYNDFLIKNGYLTTSMHPQKWHSPSIEVEIPTEEVTEEPIISIDLSDSINMDDVKFMTGLDVGIPEDDTKAREWFKNRFEEIDWVVSDDHINKLVQIYKLGGVTAWGAFHNAAVYLASNRSENTTRHEAFHVAFNLFLTPEQRQAILLEAQEKWGEDPSRDDSSIRLRSNRTYASPSLKLEERLADEFETFKEQGFVSESFKKAFPKVGKFLEDLLNFLFAKVGVLRQMFSDKMTIAQLFSAIENNSLGRNLWGGRRSIISDRIREFQDPKFKIQNADGETWTGEKVVRRVAFINKTIIPAILKDRTLAEYLKTSSLSDLFSTISIYLTNSYIPLMQKHGFKNVADVQLMASSLLDSSSDFYGYVVRDLRPTHFIDFEFDEENTVEEGWQQNYKQINPKDRVSEKLRRALSKVPFTYKGKIIRDDIGAPLYNNETELFNILMSTISNSVSIDDMKKRIADSGHQWMNDLLKYEHSLYRLAQYSLAPRVAVSARKSDKTYQFKLFNSNRRSIVNTLFNQFESNHFSLNITDFKKNIRRFPNPSLEQIKELLDNIGFVRPITELNKIPQLKNLVSNINALYEQLENKQNIFDIENKQGRTIARAIATSFARFNEDLIQSTITNVAGEKEYMHIQSGYIWKLYNEIKAGVDRLSDRMSDPFHANAPIYSFLKVAGFRETFKLALVDGVVGEERNQYKDFSFKNIHTFAFGAFISGKEPRKVERGIKGRTVFSVPTMADAPSSYTVRLPYFDVDSPTFKNLLYQVHLQEKARKDSESTGIKNYDDRKKEYHFFPVATDSAEEAKQQIFNYIESQFEEYYRETNDLGSREDLREYFINQFFWNTQLITLLSGDPAFYANSEDFQKRNKQVHAPGERGYFGNKLQYSLSIIKDIIVPFTMNLDAYPHLKEVYRKNNYTDAQGFHTLDRRKEIEEAFETWTPEKERAYQRLKKGKPANESLFFEPIKPHHYEQIKVGNLVVPFQVKYSSVTLLPSLLKANPKLSELAKNLKTEEVVFESAIKVGLHKQVELEDFKNADKILLSNDHFKLQQEIPSHFFDEYQNLGSQIRKLIEINLEGEYNGIPADELYNEVQQLLVDELKFNLDNQLLRVEDIKGYSQYLIQEITRRGLAPDIIEGLQLTKGTTGIPWRPDEPKPLEEFTIPLWHPYHSTRVENLTNALFKRATKFNLKGGTFVNVSGFSQEDLRVNIVDGKLENVDAAITVYDPELLEYFANEDGSLKDFITDADIPDHLKYKLDLILYRIPTEHKYSIFPVRARVLFHPNNGGIVMLPVEVTTIAGLDFDIDKLFAFTREDKASKVTDIPGAVGEFMNLGYEEYSKSVDRHNRLFDLMWTILTSKQHTEEFLTPGGFDNLIKLRNELTKIDKLNIASPYSNSIFIDRNLVGGRLIGVFANANAHHAIAQKLDLFTKIAFNFNGIKRSLSPKKDVTRVIAQFLAAAVDNAKEPVLGALNVNLVTADVVSLMARLGIDLDTIIYFINQPLIRDVVDKMASDMTNRRAILESTIASIKKEDLEIGEFTTTTLYMNLDGTDSNFQNNALYTFSELFATASDLQKLVRAARLDSGFGPTIADVEYSIRDMNRVFETEFFRIGNFEKAIPYTQLYDENKPFFKIVQLSELPVVNQLVEIVLGELKLFDSYFPYFSPLFQSVKDGLENALDETLTPRQINVVNKEIINYLSNEYFFVENKRKFMLEFPQRFKQFKAKHNNLKWSKLLSVLNSELVETVNGRSVPIIKARSVGGINEADMQLLRGQFEALVAAHPELQLDKYAFHTRGFTFGENSLFQFMPPTIISESYKQHLANRLYDGNPLNIVTDIILNHYNTLIPKYGGEVEMKDGLPSHFELESKASFMTYVHKDTTYLFENFGDVFIRISGKGIPNAMFEYTTNTMSTLNVPPADQNKIKCQNSIEPL